MPTRRFYSTSGWIINCDIETDFWLQVITDWDRGDYWQLTPESAYHTMDDSLITNLPINHNPPGLPPPAHHSRRPKLWVVR